ncbi:MAG TPA: MlaD family protein, partial [Steroidobacteraceae bacterium]
MERDAKYATVALFALACIVAAVAFVWWYSGRGDRRDYDTYEIYFEGTVSGLSKGSPVRYLGVDVGRVISLAVDRQDPGRVKVVAEIDAMAPVSGSTQAKLGFLGLTGLLYIDLQQDAKASPTRRLPKGERYPVIAARKGSIEASAERLPEILGQASEIMARIERLLADKNVDAIAATLANLEQATGRLPATLADAQALAADLRKISASTLELTQRASSTLQTV